MPTKKKNPSKTDLFWNRFEKSGSIQAYLRFHQARQDQTSELDSKIQQMKPKARNQAKAR